ncbi:MAG TPA: 2-oxo acid dehydrogenase subunit E2 [bacterium]|nr:2-oxo acid dehydrogenase subunit E2 [bacterium]
MPKFTRFRDAGLWREVAAAVWRAPRDPSVYGTIEVDFTNGLAFLGRLNDRMDPGAPAKITPTHLVAKAAALVLQKFPEANASLRRGRFYLREGVDLFLQVAIPTDARGHRADLSGAKICACEVKSLAEIARDLALKSERIRSRDDPQFKSTMGFLRWTPRLLRPFFIRLGDFLVHGLGVSARSLGLPEDPFGSAMVTSVGSLGAPAAFVPLFPLARSPFILCVGEVRPRPWVMGDRVVPRPVLDVAVTFDHRYLDGLTASRMNRSLVEILNEPERFMG